MAAIKPIDKKWLEGLTHRSAQKTVKPGAKAVIIPREEEMTPEHVLSWADTGEHVVIVGSDGRKHRVPKRKAPADVAGGKGKG